MSLNNFSFLSVLPSSGKLSALVTGLLCSLAFGCGTGPDTTEAPMAIEQTEASLTASPNRQENNAGSADYAICPVRGQPCLERDRQVASEPTSETKAAQAEMSSNALHSEVSTVTGNCVSARYLVVPNQIQFIPPLTTGDAEFAGNGPYVYSRVDLFLDGSALKTRVFMLALETKGGNTTAEGESRQTIWTAPPGFTPRRIVGPTSESKSYVDSNVASDNFWGAGSPVWLWSFIGDTIGSEAGTRTGVTVTFNALEIEGENCT